MKAVGNTPFRADHVGSLLRPPELLRARHEHQAGRLSTEELRRVEDAATRDAVRMQEEIGLQGVTDGEFRRGSWHMDFIYQIGGVSRAEQRLKSSFATSAAPSSSTRPRIGSAANSSSKRRSSATISRISSRWPRRPRS